MDNSPYIQMSIENRNLRKALRGNYWSQLSLGIIGKHRDTNICKCFVIPYQHLTSYHYQLSMNMAQLSKTVKIELLANTKNAGWN